MAEGGREEEPLPRPPQAQAQAHLQETQTAGGKVRGAVGTPSLATKTRPFLV